MKILIANALWGAGYCSTFTKYSLATLLSPANIPKLAERCELTFHIVTTRRDRRRLLRDPAIAEAGRYGAVEWEMIEDFFPHTPPVGPGGEKYPFLSALQNIAIRRSIDHDAIIFNYADFIWADGSLTHAVDMLMEGGERRDAVFAFCLPVDRDLGTRALEQHRRSGTPDVIDLAPRDGAKIAAECIHREAKIRFWEEAPRFTNLPSYLIWRVGDQGLLLRSYHQSILAMRVRRGDPQYLQGILRGSLDASFGAQLAQRPSLAFATDTDSVLVFSLYHTPIDSRVPPGVTREMSLRNLLTGDVALEQRPFAERPMFLRLRDGDEALWSEVAAKSWQVLQQAQDETPFDQTIYDMNLETHGVVPKIERMGFLWRRVLPPLHRLVHPFVSRIRKPSGLIGRIIDCVREPALLRASLQRRYPYLYRAFFLLGHPRQLGEALHRRLERKRIIFRDQAGSLLKSTRESFLQSFGLRRGSFVTPQVWVARVDASRYYRALAVENRAAEMTDAEHLLSALRDAEALLRETIKSTPVWIQPVRALGRNLWFQGRFREAKQAFAAAEQLRHVAAWVARWPIDSCVFLPRNCTESIGLMGHLDAFAKYKILTADPRPYYLLAPPHQVVNSAFLDYWKDHISVVSDFHEINKLLNQEAVYGVNWNWVMPRSGAVEFVHASMAAIHSAWEAAGRGPLLRLRADHAAALSKARREWGMADSERFVCLHVRTAGFYGEHREQAQLFRNTRIDDYYPLIRALTDMGLWVVRMGDRSMPPLDLAQCGTPRRVVDYAGSPQKCGELDVALCATCELFVSSPSGLHTVAHAFGRPVCEVNYPIYNGFPWHPGDVFIPQLYFSKAQGRPLALQEILGSDLVHCDHQFLLERAGISLIPNEPDDIVETVMEALAPRSYRVRQPAVADRVCATFDEFNRRHDVGVSGRLGRYFAMKYAGHLLPAPHLSANDDPGPQPDDKPGTRADQRPVAQAQA
jgi:putative glycosyltransferase (TIGR04372 family)